MTLSSLKNGPYQLLNPRRYIEQQVAEAAVSAAQPAPALIPIETQDTEVSHGRAPATD